MRGKAPTVFLTYDGHTRSLKDWAACTGIPYGCLYQRYVTRHWSPAETLSGGPRTVSRRKMPPYRHIARAIEEYLARHPEEARKYMQPAECSKRSA